MLHVALTFAVVALGVSAFIGVVWLADARGRAKLENEQYERDLRQLQDALEADARARERARGDGLLENDGHRRD